MNKAIAELVGTFIFVLFGLGAVVLGGLGGSGTLETALAFGFLLLAVVALIGAISGAHVNPAVTLGALLTGRLSVQDAVQYWIAQLVGAVAAVGVLKLLLETTDLASERTDLLGANFIDETLGTTGVFIFEALLTAALVLVYLKVTEGGASVVGAGLTYGLTFALTYLIAVPMDAGGVNPAKSVGAAVFQGNDVALADGRTVDALSDVWLFILAPLVGAVIAALVAPLLRSEEPTTRPARERVPS